MAPQADKDPDIPELYEDHRNWRLIEAIVAGVILLGIIGFLVWYFFFSTTSSNEPTPKAPPISQNQGEKNSGHNNGGTSTVRPGTSGEQKSQPKSQGSTSGNQNAKTKQNLANSGPGETIAIFLGAAAVAGLAYRLNLRRKANS